MNKIILLILSLILIGCEKTIDESELVEGKPFMKIYKVEPNLISVPSGEELPFPEEYYKKLGDKIINFDPEGVMNEVIYEIVYEDNYVLFGVSTFELGNVTHIFPDFDKENISIDTVSFHKLTKKFIFNHQISNKVHEPFQSIIKHGSFEVIND